MRKLQFKIKLCFFHLKQNVFRRIQSEGLQGRYNDPEDRTIKLAAAKLCALSFVPPDEVPEVFSGLCNDIPDDFLPIADYFEVNYVNGRKAQGRRRAVAPRYPPEQWNHYSSILEGTSRTNNPAEGWNNRFQHMVGKFHPSFYKFLVELQKEQATTETMLIELRLGQRVRRPQTPKSTLFEQRISNIVHNFDKYESYEDYLTNLACNIRF